MELLSILMKEASFSEPEKRAMYRKITYAITEDVAGELMTYIESRRPQTESLGAEPESPGHA